LLPVVILTASATLELAVESLRRGAFDFLTKPFTPDGVRAVVDRAIERIGLRRENRLLRGELGRFGFASELLGEGLAMRAVKERIALVAPTNAGPADFPLSGVNEDGVDADPVRACASALPATLDLRQTLERFEKELINRALADAQGIQAEAARRLNVSRGDIAGATRDGTSLALSS
jgi:DNA-binding NtrC family response regulator